MTIEDRYGDLQETFYKSKNGDIVGQDERVGFIEKKWTTIHVLSNNNSQDLYNWLNQEQYQIKYNIYRFIKKNEGFNNISFSEVENIIKNKQLKLVVDN